MKKEYDRVPFVVGRNTIGVVHLFHRHDCFEDMWMSECFHDDIDFNKNAEQFLNQLEEHWPPIFLMALRDEIIKKLKEHDKEFGTEFA